MNFVNKIVQGDSLQILKKDAKNSTEVKSFHIEKWTEILKEYGLKKNV